MPLSSRFGLQELPVIPKDTVLSGDARTELSQKIAACYRRGATVRQISERTSRSFGVVLNLLREAGADIRPRGGKYDPDRVLDPGE